MFPDTTVLVAYLRTARAAIRQTLQSSPWATAVPPPCAGGRTGV